MLYQDVEFTDGAFLTEADLDQLSENAEVVRGELNVYPVISADCNYFGGPNAFSYLDLLVDGVNLPRISSFGEFSATYDMGQTDDGLVEVEAILGLESAQTESFKFKICKSPEMLYLTIFGEIVTDTIRVSGGEEEFLQVKGLTAIGHRETNDWN